MPRYTVRATIPKRALTFEECNELLRTSKQENPWGKFRPVPCARMHGNMFLLGDHSSSKFLLRYYSVDPDKQWSLASIGQSTGGNTMYRLEITRELRNWMPKRARHRRAGRTDPPGYKEWRDFAERLTPYVRPAKPSADEVQLSHLYLAQKDGSFVCVPESECKRYVLDRMPLACMEPTSKAWVSGSPSDRAFSLRHRRFAHRLKRELADLAGSVRRFGFHPGYERGHPPIICVAPVGREYHEQKMLVLELTQHDDYSRRWFHADGDYTRRHILVRGTQFNDHPSWWRRPKFWDYPGSAPCKGTYIWPCANDAVVGIKEWLMDQLHIPGL